MLREKFKNTYRIFQSGDVEGCYGKEVTTNEGDEQMCRRHFESKIFINAIFSKRTFYFIRQEYKCLDRGEKTFEIFY